ncbi:MAG: response regulator transcription factor [Roseivirga sp.]|nr:response regulator transcription factor [Roseivirga sp.]
MIRCIAIDDEPQALDVLSIHTAKIPFVNLVAVFRDAMKAFKFMEAEQVDVIFLDINMPDISGVEFARLLADGPLIIFTTAYSEYALESYEVEALDYLLKPISFSRLMKSLNKAQERLALNEPPASTTPKTSTERDYLFIRSGTQDQKVFFQDILYIESDGNYLTYMTVEKKIISRINMTNAIAQLPQDVFIRIHKSFIISFSHLSFVDAYQVGIGEKHIPIGSSYREAFQTFLAGK